MVAKGLTLVFLNNPMHFKARFVIPTVTSIASVATT